MITLTPAQLWQLLTHNCEAIDSVSLVRYPEIVQTLKEIDKVRGLFVMYNLHLDLRQPSHPILWRGDKWLEEVKRSAKMGESYVILSKATRPSTTPTNPAPPANDRDRKKSALRQALVASGISEDGVDIMIGLLKQAQLEQLYIKHQIL